MATCSIEGCDGTVKSRGWCQAHYMRWFSKGDTGDPVVIRRPKGRKCSVPGCDRKHQGRGYCDGHLRRFIATGDPGPAEFEPRRPGAICSIPGCGKPVQGRGWCNAHYLRWRGTGDPLTPVPEHPGTWTGDAASYTAVHARLRAQRGPASAHACISCGGAAQHWAYDHTDPDPSVDKGLPYSTDLSRYHPMCQPCHRRMDAKRKVEERRRASS